MFTNSKYTLVMIGVLIGTAVSVSSAELVCYWNFNGTPPGMDGSDYLVDRVGDADGVLLNGADYVVSRAGQTQHGMGNAIAFDDIDDYIVLLCPPPEEFNFGTSDFTISGWFIINSVTNEDYFHMLLENAVSDYGGINLWVGPSSKSYAGKLGFDVKGFHDNIAIASNNRVDDNAWHWFAVISENLQIRMYVDGVRQTSTAIYQTMTTATPPSNAVTILGRKIGGQLDEFRIYDTALETIENNNTLMSGPLYDLWQAPIQGLTAYWHFDHTAGTDLLEDAIDTAEAQMQSGASFTASRAGLDQTGFGNAGTFDCFDDDADLGYSFPNAFDLGRHDFTVTGWFKADAADNENFYHVLVGAETYDVGGIAVWLGPGDKTWIGKLGVDIRGLTSDNISVLSDTRLDNNQWHWFAAVVQNTQLSLYVDGIKQQQTAAYGPSTTATPSVQDSAVIGSVFGGQMDDLKIYNTALTVVLSGNNVIDGQLYESWQTTPTFTSCEQAVRVGYTRKGDLTQDCTINFEDMIILLENWLKCNDPQVADCN